MTSVSYEEFKRTCYYTKDLFKVPLLGSAINKKELHTKGKYDHNKEDDYLRTLYENSINKLKKNE